jgi:hypothetical protein
LEVTKDNKIGSVPLQDQVDAKYFTGQQQAYLALAGHSHMKAYVLGFTWPTPMESLKKIGDLTVPDDYRNVLSRGNDVKVKDRAPALVVTPFGVVVYGTEPPGVYGSTNSYILYKSLK